MGDETIESSFWFFLCCTSVYVVFSNALIFAAYWVVYGLHGAFNSSYILVMVGNVFLSCAIGYLGYWGYGKAVEKGVFRQKRFKNN